MKKRPLLIIGGVVIVIAILFAAVFFSNPTAPFPQRNTNSGNQNARSIPPTLTLDESFGDLFDTPKSKETTFYEMAFIADLSDPTRAAKLRKVQFALEEKAKSGDAAAQKVLDEFTTYKTDANTRLSELQKQSCSDLEKQLLENIPVDTFVKNPPLYQKQIEQIASPDYIDDLRVRKKTVLLKKALLDNEEESCKTISGIIRQKSDELAAKGDLGPLPPTPEIIQRANLDLSGRDPVSSEFYVPELDTANVRPDFESFSLANGVQLPAPTGKKLPIYQLYSFLKFKDVKDLGKLLGIEGNPQKNDFMSYTLEGKDGSYLQVNQMSGVFNYRTPSFSDMVRAQSFPQNLSNEQKSKLSELARQFLESKKLLPSPVTPPHYYQKKSSSSFFVEFKMGSEKPGSVEQLNGIAIINNDKVQLKDPLTFPPAPEYRLPDSSIVDTSDRTEGFARSDNQNTITVEMQPVSERIVGIKYNLRRIKRTLPEVEIMSAQEAFENLRKEKGVLFDIIPAEDNTDDWKTIFPDFIARSDTAQVNEVYLGYVNKTHLFPQEYLVPAYIFKGSARLKTGYTINFTAVVSAIAEQP